MTESLLIIHFINTDIFLLPVPRAIFKNIFADGGASKKARNDNVVGVASLGAPMGAPMMPGVPMMPYIPHGYNVPGFPVMPMQPGMRMPGVCKKLSLFGQSKRE